MTLTGVGVVVPMSDLFGAGGERLLDALTEGESTGSEWRRCVAEIGEVARFKSARHLCSWTGLTPTHRESDEKVRRGHITKKGSLLVRWAAVEAVARQHGWTAVSKHHRAVAEHRGNQIGRVAAARKLLILVYYGPRDGEIRCLAEPG
jgi:hypothetical protein